MDNTTQFSASANKIAQLTTAIFEESEPQIFAIFSYTDEWWPSHLDGNPVILERLHLGRNLGRIVLSRSLRYQSTDKLTSRNFNFDAEGYINQVIAGSNRADNIIKRQRQMRFFSPTVADYQLVISELEHGLIMHGK